MSPESLDLAKAWLAKSHSDLATAELLICGDERYLDTGCYHCQQAAEKALKAWLTANEAIFTKTHSLEVLIALAAATEPGFQCFLTHAIELTPLATEFRYPGDVFQPSPPEAERVLKLAKELCDWILTNFAKFLPPTA